MSPETAVLIQTIAGASSIVVAIAALAVAIRSEKRAEDHSIKRLELEEEVIRAQFKPIVVVGQKRTNTSQRIRMYNHGNGTAIISKLKIAKDDRVAERNMLELLEFPKNYDIHLGNYRSTSGGRIYLRPGEELYLLELWADTPKGNGISKKEANKIIKTFFRQIKGITITFNYQNVLGKDLQDYEKILK